MRFKVFNQRLWISFRGVERNIFLKHFQTSSLNFVHYFWLKSWNLKLTFADESLLNITTFFSSNFFEFFFIQVKLRSKILFWTQFLHFDNEWSSSYLQIIPYPLRFMMNNNFHYKNNLSIHKFQRMFLHLDTLFAVMVNNKCLQCLVVITKVLLLINSHVVNY